ncbi:MAG: aldo/keto reductase [Erysipelotrichaceae bacterium]|nr:aldo/keto reductase [Erysipelotrichaceae bacterium]
MAKEFYDLGFGTTQFWYGMHEESFLCLEAAYREYGIRMIDTAEMYGDGRCEEAVGAFLKKHGRDDFYIVDKILPYNVTEKNIRKSLENSLERLRTDHIDLYLLHWRENAGLDLFTETMEEFRKEGKILEWGVSNFDVSDMEDLMKCRYGNRCYADQIFYNPDKRGAEYDLLPYLNEHDIHAMAYSSLDTRNVRRKIAAIPEVEEILEKENISVERFMLDYIRMNHVSALFQTSSLKHLRDNMKGKDFDITVYREIIREIFPKIDRKIPLEKR